MDEQLQADFYEAEMLESEKRGPGRPKGSGNKSSSKTATRLRVRLHRERKAEEAEELRASQDRLFKDMRSEGLLFFGETAPTVNCASIAEEIEMARIWARLLDVEDIQRGQNQKNFILQVMQKWCAADCPLLDFATQTLSKRKVDPPDINKYEFPNGCDTPFQTETQVTK